VDEHRESLADRAAAWVPPWDREPETAATPEPAPAPEPDSATAATPEPAPDPEAPSPGGDAHAAAPEPDSATAAAPEPESEREPEWGPGIAPLGGEGDIVQVAERERSSEPGEAVPVPSQETPIPAEPAPVDEAELRAALEAILLVVDEPVTDAVLASVLEQPTGRVTAALAELSAGYTAAGHGFDLRRAAGGWRLYTRPEYAGYVERFVLGGQQVRLTQAALETLAVVAYKQPVTRSRISAIRGVNCDGVIRTLVTRGLVEECGTEPDSGAYLYRTTTLFLEKVGLDSVAELPPLAPFLPDDVEEIADADR
jgi:segregation and condensation protein B